MPLPTSSGNPFDPNDIQVLQQVLQRLSLGKTPQYGSVEAARLPASPSVLATPSQASRMSAPSPGEAGQSGGNIISRVLARLSPGSQLSAGSSGPLGATSMTPRPPVPRGDLPAPGSPTPPTPNPIVPLPNRGVQQASYGAGGDLGMQGGQSAIIANMLRDLMSGGPSGLDVGGGRDQGVSIQMGYDRGNPGSSRTA